VISAPIRLPTAVSTAIARRNDLFFSCFLIARRHDASLLADQRQTSESAAVVQSDACSPNRLLAEALSADSTWPRSRRLHHPLIDGPKDGRAVFQMDFNLDRISKFHVRRRWLAGV
jgi:hypothetical protein